MSRPRGFCDWRPQAKTKTRLDAVLAVLEEYAAYLPLTLRQIFYRLVGKDLIGKDEAQYNGLIELCGRARRARIIPMDSIRDDGFSGSLSTGEGWSSPDEWIEAVVDETATYRRDRQEGQKISLLVWCEASGMLPQLERVCSPYGIAVASSGGFDSLTVKHQAGRMLGGTGLVEVLHVGDFDPSGECMFDALAEDVASFAFSYGNVVAFSRLAVTEDHIREFDLPTAPPKPSSHQDKKRMIETVQAEALDPATLAQILEDGILDRIDLDVYRLAVETEAAEREALHERLIWMVRADRGAA